LDEFCDYEGSDYKERFWTSERRYEDLVERRAIRCLLPSQGRALVELGAGFGRLADLYGGYEKVFLVDYSRSLLAQARQRLGNDERFTYVASDIRRLPLATGAFEAAVTVRVLHHIRNIAPAIQEASRILMPSGVYVLEFANKRNMKAIARYVLRAQSWDPFAREPVEFVHLNFNFHPADIHERLVAVGLTIEAEKAVSIFRWQPLKRALGARRLAKLESVVQPVASLLPLSPSVILRARREAQLTAHPGHYLACPDCRGPLNMEATRVTCPECDRSWPQQDGILDFRG